MRLRDAAKRLVPLRLRRFLRRPLRAAYRALPSRPVDFGSLRRLTPLRPDFGLARGRPVDRYYIENFMEQHRSDVRGRVLEILSADYTRRYGHDVEKSDVLHPTADNPDATLIGDLATGVGIPDAAFDCVICTQTLHLIYDLPGAIATLHRALAPGGVLLATLPSVSQISRYDADRWGDYWRVTSLAARRLFSHDFDDPEVTGHGNVLAAISFLHGITTEDLRPEELDYSDPDYEVLIAVRAVRRQ